VICDRCGRDNPDHLIFCQDCGRRLQEQRRVVPPTPPAGIPAMRATGGGARALAEPAAPARQPVAPTMPDPSVQEVVCGRCQTRNPESGRFCVSCGAPLAAGGQGGTASAPATSADKPAAVPVSPAAVLQVAPSPSPAPSTVTCDRCQGVCDAAMRFCKFCGAPLGVRARPEPAMSAGSAPAPVPAGLVSQAAPAASSLNGAAFGVVAAAQVAGPPDVAVAAARPALSSSPERSMTRPTTSQAPSETRPDAVHGRPTGAGVSTQTGQYLPFAGAVSLPGGRLVVVGGDGQEGPSFPMTGDQVDIGRIEGNVVLPDDKYMSPRHARIVRLKNQWFVRDLESTNGVFVRLSGPHDLTDGDLLLVGVEVLRFEVVKDAELGLGPAIQHGTLVFGSPALPRPARLVQRTVEGVARDVYHLHRPETVLGRESGDIVFTDDPYMSRRHAMIRRSAASGTFTLTDLGSSNGTFVAIRGDWLLQDGDSIRVGQHLFRVELAPG